MDIGARDLGCLHEYLRLLRSIYITAEGIRTDEDAWKNTTWKVGEAAVECVRRIEELAARLHKKESETLTNFYSCVCYLKDRKLGLPTSSVVASRYADWWKTSTVSGRSIESLVEYLSDGHGCDAVLTGALTPLAAVNPNDRQRRGHQVSSEALLASPSHPVSTATTAELARSHAAGVTAGRLESAQQMQAGVLYTAPVVRPTASPVQATGSAPAGLPQSPMVGGYLNLDRIFSCDVTKTEAIFGNASIPHVRKNEGLDSKGNPNEGLFGLECIFCAGLPGLKWGGKEYTRESWKEMHGCYPFTKGSTAPQLKRSEVIMHHEEKCFHGWLRLRNYVKSHPEDAALLTPLNPAEWAAKSRSLGF